VARPRAEDWLETEVAEWKTFDIDVVASLLGPAEVFELGLQREAEVCRSRGLDFISFPIPDRGVPNIDEAAQIFRCGGRRLA
jgi:hypothetical protein